MAAGATNTRYVTIYPWPLSEAHMGALKAAKGNMGVDWKIIPQKSTGHSWDRVLAFGEKPPHIVDYLLVDPENEKQIQDGIIWATDYWVDNPAAVTVKNVLQSIFGPDLKEIPDGQ